MFACAVAPPAPGGIVTTTVDAPLARGTDMPRVDTKRIANKLATDVLLPGMS